MNQASIRPTIGPPAKHGVSLAGGPIAARFCIWKATSPKLVGVFAFYTDGLKNATLG